MLTQPLLVLLASAGLIEGRSINLDELFFHKRADGSATATTLAANAIQSGSFLDGSQEIGAAEVGQAKSLTSQNNFINNCAGKTLTNGLQITTGSCNGITMGDIPAKTNMVSSIITFPLSGSNNIESDTTFNITVQVSNLVAGSFTNADATYYAAPQFLSGGNVVGHTHVTVQDLGRSLNPSQPLDPTQFAFFKGINDAGNGRGLLQAVVTGGLPAGNYRVCTMASASNHQPVLMPVAQRGTPDDCTKFTVIGNGKVANAASNNGEKGQAAAALAASAVAGAKDGDIILSSAASSASEASTTTAASDKGKGRGGNRKGNKGTTTSTSEASTTTKADDGKGAKAVDSAAQSETTTIVQKVTVVETFFEFISSLGGLPPSVSKKSGSSQFAVLEEVFEDLSSAASAACGHQYETCIGFSGPGFSFEECQIQQTSCSAAAQTATPTANTPGTITATVTVPTSATVTGQIIAESTIQTTFAVTTTAAAADVAASDAASVAASGSACPATSTVFVDEPTAAPDASLNVKPSAIVQQLPASTTSSASTASATSTSSKSAAVGGIAAPPVTNSGNSARPFEVNGNTFVNKSAAVQRSCDIQFNACANAFNGGKANGAFKLADCSAQQTACQAAGGS